MRKKNTENYEPKDDSIVITPQEIQEGFKSVEARKAVSEKARKKYGYAKTTYWSDIWRTVSKGIVDKSLQKPDNSEQEKVRGWIEEGIRFYQEAVTDGNVEKLNYWTGKVRGYIRMADHFNLGINTRQYINILDGAEE